MIGGPDGYFPDKKYDFLEEEVAENISIPNELDSPNIENHYPVNDAKDIDNLIEVPKPRQIFASSGDSSVQLRRLGELMWIYIETLPSTSWPISKNYWDTSTYDVLKADPVSGEIDIDLWKGVIDADINGFFNLIKSGLPYLRESKGSIVFISSAGLFKYPPGDILSVAPKATIEHVLKGIAKEEGANGVRANSIALGIIETGIFHRLREEENTFFDDAWHEAVMNTLAIKRFGLPKEVADTAVFLASSKGGYITGHCIPVDGGYHL